MNIYIASSWKNRHAVEMLTALLRERSHFVASFVENCFGEDYLNKGMAFDEWVRSDDGRKAFLYDTNAVKDSDLVIYISPSGVDAWAEVGLAYAKGVPIFGLHAKGEQSGVMRLMVNWFHNYDELLVAVDSDSKAGKV